MICLLLSLQNVVVFSQDDRSKANTPVKILASLWDIKKNARIQLILEALAASLLSRSAKLLEFTRGTKKKR